MIKSYPQAVSNIYKILIMCYLAKSGLSPGGKKGENFV